MDKYREQVQALSVLQTIAANVNNEKINDKDFREFVANSISTVKSAEEVMKRSSTN